MDNRRKWIIAALIPFGLVTVVHVTAYAASFEPSNLTAWLGLPYALAVEGSIVVAAYFTKWQTTARWAWAGYFAFVLASGLMNVGYLSPESGWSVAAVAAWTYALFPTVAIALLGFLYRQVDSLVAGKEARQARLDAPQIRIEKPQAPALPEPAALDAPHVCEFCRKEFGKPQGLSAHLRFCGARALALSQQAADESKGA